MWTVIFIFGMGFSFLACAETVDFTAPAPLRSTHRTQALDELLEKRRSCKSIDCKIEQGDLVIEKGQVLLKSLQTQVQVAAASLAPSDRLSAESAQLRRSLSTAALQKCEENHLGVLTTRDDFCYLNAQDEVIDAQKDRLERLTGLLEQLQSLSSQSAMGF